MYGCTRYIAAVLLLVVSVFGIPSSLIEDVRVARMASPRSTDVFLPNKAKRAKEVFMYGNQQGQMPFSELNKYQRVARYPRKFKKDVSNVRYISPPLSIEQRISKRSQVKRRSLQRVRAKRDSEIDPKDLLLLLALWESKLGLKGKYRGSWNTYLEDLNNNDGYNWNEYDNDNSQLSDFDDPRSGEWLDSPVIPSAHQIDEMPMESRWNNINANRKRFMISKRYQNRDDGGIPRYYNNQVWKRNVPMYRRMIR